jgi:hypothetical protein
VSTTARIHLDRALSMFDRLGGSEVRAVAERFFTEPTAEHLDEYLEVCGPFYSQRPRPPSCGRGSRATPMSQNTSSAERFCASTSPSASERSAAPCC